MRLENRLGMNNELIRLSKHIGWQSLEEMKALFASTEGAPATRTRFFSLLITPILKRSFGFVAHDVDRGCFMTGAPLWIPAFAGMTGSVLREWREPMTTWVIDLSLSFPRRRKSIGHHSDPRWGSFLESTEPSMPGSIFQAHLASIQFALNKTIVY